MSSIFRSYPSRRQYITSEQRAKLHRDYIKARDAFHQAVEQVHRDRKRLVTAGFVSADDEAPEQ
jgi:hypothetical protein